MRFEGTKLTAHSSHLASVRSLRFDVYRRLGDLSQELVGVSFLVQRGLEELSLVVEPKLASVGARAAVASDLVVLDMLGFRDEANQASQEPGGTSLILIRTLTDDHNDLIVA